MIYMYVHYSTQRRHGDFAEYRLLLGHLAFDGFAFRYEPCSEYGRCKITYTDNYKTNSTKDINQTEHYHARTPPVLSAVYQNPLYS